MSIPLILASASEIRQDLLKKVGLSPVIEPANLDEDQWRQDLENRCVPASDVARYLAVAKASSVSEREPNALVIGADQILLLDQEILTKPLFPCDAIAQLKRLRGRTHKLVSAVAVAEAGQVTWHVEDTAALDMRDLTDEFIDRYVEEEWYKIRWTVGCYMIEDRGVSLFKSVRGDYHTILGLPIFDLLSYLEHRGFITL